MKKLLALLLILTLCLGAFVACENGENEHYECLGVFKHKIYSHYSIDDFSRPDKGHYGHCYDVATTYEEFAEIVEDTRGVSESVFKDYFIFVSTKYDDNSGTYSSQEYKNFRVENGIAYLDRYVTYSEEVGEGSSIETHCFLISRKLLGKQELNITGFEVTEHGTFDE